MEGIKRPINQIANKITNHPHISIFCLLLVVSILINSIMISFMGISSFVDSFNNPTDYIFLPSDQLKDSSSQIMHGAAIVQKQSHPFFSMNQTETICIQNAQGTYTIRSQTTRFIDSKDSNQIIGKVITVIPDTPLSMIACLWWKQSIQIINTIDSS